MADNLRAYTREPILSFIKKQLRFVLKPFSFIFGFCVKCFVVYAFFLSLSILLFIIVAIVVFDGFPV